MLAAGYKDTRDDVLSYMRFVGAEETDDERLLAYVDRGPEALKFFEDCGIRFRISRGLTDHYFGVAPGSVAEGRCLNTDFIAATDLGEWQDSILAPRDTPIEVNSEELFNWGGIANINNWPKDVLEERRRKQDPHPRRRRHHPFRQAAPGPRRHDQARHARAQPRRPRTAASPASSPTRAASRAHARRDARLRRLRVQSRRWRKPTRACRASSRCSRRPSTATA